MGILWRRGWLNLYGMGSYIGIWHRLPRYRSGNRIANPAFARSMCHWKVGMTASTRVFMHQRDGSGRIRPELYYGVIEQIREWVLTACWHSRMSIYDGSSPIEFRQHWIESRTAKPFVRVAGEQTNAVRLQDVECIVYFAQAAFSIGQRNGCKHPEPSWEVRPELRRIVIAFPSKAPPLTEVTKTDSRRTDGGDRSSDTGLVHIIDRFLRGPIYGRLCLEISRFGKIFPDYALASATKHLVAGQEFCVVS